ncbi:TetR/AcrR family transcriptional regulator [Cupriavidus sp. CP313]
MHGKALEQETLHESEGPQSDMEPVARGNRELRLAQIILAALQTFQEDGYAGFGTRRVAGRVGITLGNLQYYFRTREELLRAALETKVRQIIRGHTAIASQPGTSPTRRCSELVDRVFHDINETDMPRFLLELWAFSQHESYAAELVEDMHSEYRNALAKLLSEIHPTLTNEQCLVRASILIVQMAGLVIANHFGKDSDRDFSEFVRLARRAVKMIIGLPPQDLEGSTSTHDALGYRADGKGSVHIRFFGSAEHAKQGLFELSLRQPGQDAPYYRPTVQGKRREVKINEIVTTAANLLAVEGYASFTLARVARELDTPPSALKNYFPTHDDLVRSTVSALMNAYLERYAEMGRPSGKPAMERLREIVDDAFEEARDPRICQFTFELFALAQHSDLTLNFLRKPYSVYRAIFVDLVREIDSSATARECHTRARLIAAQMDGSMILMFDSRKQDLDLDRVFDLMRAITIRIAHGNIATKEAA